MSLIAIKSKIQNLKKEIDNLSPLAESDAKRLWKKFRLEFNYNSNHIVGNTLTYGQTKLLLILDKVAWPHSNREVKEMKAHDAAISLTKEWADDSTFVLNENDIRNLHEIVLVKDYFKIKSIGQVLGRSRVRAGEYKKQPNHVDLPNGDRFYYTEPDDVPMEMGKLINWFRKESSNLPPLELAALLHYRFVRIHPFDDGNGRVSRLLMNYVLMKNGYPPVIIKSADKNNYLDALNKADSGNINAFVEYIGEQLIWSLELKIKAANGESIEEDDDLDKELEIWQKQFTKGNKYIIYAKMYWKKLVDWITGK